jgi:hypothetical protein
METQMRSHILASSTAAALVLAGASVSAHAQRALPSPSVAHSLLSHVKPQSNPGTGTFATSMVAGANQKPQSLGNAASVTFADATAGTGQIGASIAHQGSTVQVQYPTDNQMAASLAKAPCATGGCPISDFKIQMQNGANVMTWDRQNVLITQLQMSPAVSVALRYERMVLTTTPAAENGSTGGTLAPATTGTYNTATQKAQ